MPRNGFGVEQRWLDGGTGIHAGILWPVTAVSLGDEWAVKTPPKGPTTTRHQALQSPGPHVALITTPCAVHLFPISGLTVPLHRFTTVQPASSPLAIALTVSQPSSFFLYLEGCKHLLHLAKGQMFKRCPSEYQTVFSSFFLQQLYGNIYIYYSTCCSRRVPCTLSHFSPVLPTVSQLTSRLPSGHST